jgi:peptide/nickel transport system permease protein
MIRYVAGRFAASALTLLVASIAIFFVMEILPGDPARLMLGVDATEDAVIALQREMGLNRPVGERYWRWLSGFAAGDLGRSLTYSVPVAELVAERAAVSVPLALMAMAMLVAVALPAGLYAAARRGRAGDITVMGATQIGLAIPNFWFALLLIYVFAVWLRLTPAGGFPGWSAGIGPALKALALPAIALALPQAAILARVTRSAVIDVLGEDYIRTARAKGLSGASVLWRHALRNAMIPVSTILGLQLAFLIAGGIIIENVFYLPGIGRLVFQAITQRDLVVVESVAMLLVASVVAINFLVDLSYALIDPRLRRST